MSRVIPLSSGNQIIQKDVLTWMRKLSGILALTVLGLVALVVLTAPDVHLLREDRIGFDVRESDHLYFRNLRQFYYRSEPTQNGQFDLFRLKRFKEVSTSPLEWVIISNWRQDQAYIYLQGSEELTGKLELRSPGEERVAFKLDNLNAQDHLSIAVEAYDALQRQGVAIFWLSEQEAVEVWVEPEERIAMITVLKDFFKLTGSY